MSADISFYLSLITSEHASKPFFVAVISTLVQGPADGRQVVDGLPGDFDLDTATGTQLDTIGLWVGRSRFVTIPLASVYFSFDVGGLGFDQGTWLGPFDPTTGLVKLPDDSYRTLLRAVIAANSWDGSIPGAYNAFNNILFVGQPFIVLVQDNQDMSMILALWGPSPNAVILALFQTGELSLKPAGVRETFMVPSVSSTSYFGFDVENQYISGFDVGAWGTISTIT